MEPMAGRHLVTLLVFLAVALVPALLEPDGVARAAPSPDEVPAEAIAALSDGRYLRASRILRQHLAERSDTTPRTMLLVARADAGWGDWRAVRELLAGRAWLDSIAGGYGWKLLGRSLYEQGDFSGGDQALSRYLAVADGADSRERGITELRRAFSLREAGRPTSALEAFAEARRLLPRLEDWILLWTAQAAAEAGDTMTVRTALEETDPELAQRFGWGARVRAFRAAGDRLQAERSAQAATMSLPQASQRAEAWTLIGDVRIERGDTAGARDAYTRAIEAASGASSAVQAARQLSSMRGLSPEDHLRIGRVYLRHGNRERGVAGLRTYLDTGSPSATTRAEVELELGRALFADGQYDQVSRRMLELAGSAGSPRIASEAMYLAARAQYRDGDRSRAIETLRRVPQRFEGQPATVRANFLIADLAHDEGELQTARTYYRRAIEAGPEQDEAGLSMMRLGGLAFQQGDHAEALEVFTTYLGRFPNGRRAQQAAYWAGRAAAELGRAAESREHLRRARGYDPLTFYGFRAAELLGVRPDSIPLEPAPAEALELRGELAAGMARVDLLRDLDRSAAADFELERLRSHFAARDGGSYLIAEALNSRGMTYSGIMIGRQILEAEGAYNPRLLRIVYPFPYMNVVADEARELGLDPFVVAGLIRQESMFSATAVSGVGARGLMQIMPETGRGLARGAGIRDWDVGILTRPEVNIHLGVRYFAELLDRYDGRVSAALAAYNAGPTRVARWSRLPEWEDEELFIERIPYDETRDYVKKVQQNARIYRFVYGADETFSR